MIGKLRARRSAACERAFVQSCLVVSAELSLRSVFDIDLRSSTHNARLMRTFPLHAIATPMSDEVDTVVSFMSMYAQGARGAKSTARVGVNSGFTPSGGPRLAYASVTWKTSHTR